MVALLMGCFRQSKSRVALFLEQVLGQPCSPGWVVKLQRQATAALQPAYQELVDKLPEEDHLRIDETDQRGEPQIVAVDLRGRGLHRIRHPAHARRHGAS
jgi:hypothetical protein